MADEADHELFRTAVGNITPLPAPNRASLHRPAPKHFSSPTTIPAAHVPDNLSDFSDGDIPAEFLSNGYSRLALRKARRSLTTQARLDLHGYLTDAARKRLQQFLHDAIHNGVRCVLIIHGKGLNSRDGEAVLKRLTRHWLIQHHAVLAFCDAPLAEGGNGAVWVLLKAVPFSQTKG